MVPCLNTPRKHPHSFCEDVETHVKPKDCRSRPFNVETKVSFPRGWLEMVKVSGLTCGVLSTIYFMHFVSRRFTFSSGSISTDLLHQHGDVITRLNFVAKVAIGRSNTNKLYQRQLSV
jgi:hypothetical protein